MRFVCNILSLEGSTPSEIHGRVIACIPRSTSARVYCYSDTCSYKYGIVTEWTPCPEPLNKAFTIELALVVGPYVLVNPPFQNTRH